MNLITTLKTLKAFIHFMTFDQGSEFMKYGLLKDCLDTEIYFCDPASPQQKGAIENGNGVISSELPRQYDLDSLSQNEITQLIDEINGRPLKCLGYRTPKEVFLEYTEKKRQRHHENQYYQEGVPLFT